MKPVVQIYKNLDALDHAAARKLLQTARWAVRERGRFLLALSGGNTPIGLYRLLSRSPFRDEIKWGLVNIFWGDERCVPMDAPESNYGQAMQVWLRNVPIPKGNVCRIRSDIEPATAAFHYTTVLKAFATPPLEWPRFDLVVLGLGEDGHIASIFSDFPMEESTPVIAVNARYEDRPVHRVTLTPPVFNSARNIMFLVSGQGKSKMLERVLYGEYQPMNLPAQRINPSDGEVTWMVDEAAASKLKNRIALRRKT
jgi:6-phosphogluconolactonase